jgi:hypothetical protein
MIRKFIVTVLALGATLCLALSAPRMALAGNTAGGGIDDPTAPMARISCQRDAVGSTRYQRTAMSAQCDADALAEPLPSTELELLAATPCVDVVLDVEAELAA